MFLPITLETYPSKTKFLGKFKMFSWILWISTKLGLNLDCER